MSDPLILEQLEVAGTPREMGRAQGEAFRNRIHAFVEMRFEAVQQYMRDRQRGTFDALLDVGRRSFEIYKTWDPEGYEEQRGIAEGADFEPEGLFTATNMTDLRDAVLLSDASGTPLTPKPEEGCTSVLVPGSHSVDGAPLAAQTWDLNPPDVDYVVAVKRTPKDGPRTWAITCTGCLSLMGINEHGLAVGTTNIKTYGSRPGVGYLSILHRAIRAASAEEAAALVKAAPHAGAHTYWLADETQQLEWEASPNGQFRRDTQSGPIGRTNHCLTPLHRDLQGEVPNESTQRRFARVELGLGAGQQSVDTLKALFGDRSDGVHSINRYPEDEQGTATNAVFIALPASRRAFACRGPADRGEWVELTFR